MAVGGPEERLDRAVPRVLLVLGRQRRKRHIRLERLAERAREVRHRVVPLDAAGRPVPRLTRAVRRLAEVRQARPEQVEIHAATVALGS